MRADTKAELQMLRELAWFVFGSGDTDWVYISRACCFCDQNLLAPGPTPTFGHHHHSAPPLDLTLHHVDGDRNNNDIKNINFCHDSCHRRYHATKRAAERREIIKRVEEKQNEVSE